MRRSPTCRTSSICPTRTPERGIAYHQPLRSMTIPIPTRWHSKKRSSSTQSNQKRAGTGNALHSLLRGRRQAVRCTNSLNGAGPNGSEADGPTCRQAGDHPGCLLRRHNGPVVPHLLDGHFEDSAQLRTLQKRAAGDELHLHGNLWTGIATTTARLKPGAKRSR
jgi:hypothetical protein